MFLAVRPGAPSSVLAPSSDALVTSSDALVPSSFLFLTHPTNLLPPKVHRAAPRSAALNREASCQPTGSGVRPVPTAAVGSPHFERSPFRPTLQLRGLELVSVAFSRPPWV